MPRKARIDVPGCLYHVISRGNERKPIFQNSADYEDFLARLREGLKKAQAKCLAWCLMPNHFHLCLLRGSRPLSECMGGLLTGYAVSFNLKYRRSGHLFQNRYTSVVCEADSYLKELVSYIHLNPLRAGLEKEIRKLGAYPRCGHGALIGERPEDFLDAEYALAYFEGASGGARQYYLDYLKEAYSRQKPGQYSNIAVPKHESRALTGQENPELDELFESGVLGRRTFVDELLRKADAKSVEKMTKKGLLDAIQREFSVSGAAIFSRSRERRISSARAVYSFLAKEECGITGTELARELNVSSSGLSRLVFKGREIRGQINN